MTQNERHLNGDFLVLRNTTRNQEKQMWSSQTGTCLYQAKGGKKGITQFCGQTIWNHEKQTNKKNTSTHRDNVSDILSCCSSLTI